MADLGCLQICGWPCRRLGQLVVVEGVSPLAPVELVVVAGGFVQVMDCVLEWRSVRPCTDLALVRCTC